MVRRTLGALSRTILLLTVLFGGGLLGVPELALASPGGTNQFGFSAEIEGMDNINTAGAEGTMFYGGGVSIQYWVTPGFGFRLGADYFNNSKTAGPLPQSILPLYSGLMVNLLTGAYGSLDIVGDFGQVLNDGVDNTYFDGGFQYNSLISGRKQFFLDVRFREDGVGTMPKPWQFITVGLGISFF